MEPQYTIVPILRTSHVNRGEKVIITFFISGVGEVKNNKLWIGTDYPYLLCDEDPGVAKPGYVIEDGQLIPLSDSSDPTSHDLDLPPEDVGIFIKLPDQFFKTIDVDNGGNLVGVLEFSEQNEYSRQKLGEITYGGEKPIKLELNIAKDAPPGNYNIPVVFTYSGKNTTEHDSFDVQFHVNTKREEYEPWPTRVAVGAGIAAVLSLIWQTGIIEFFINLIPIS